MSIKGFNTENGVQKYDYNSLDNLPSNTDVDYIIAQGTSNGWTYRKWKNGFAECWITTPLEYTNEEIEASPDYHAFVCPGKQYPFEFAEEPVALGTARGSAPDGINDCSSLKFEGTGRDNTGLIIVYVEHELVFSVCGVSEQPVVSLYVSGYYI